MRIEQGQRAVPPAPEQHTVMAELGRHRIGETAADTLFDALFRW